jgi:diguanylate cyclase (GGDEF)-like protein
MIINNIVLEKKHLYMQLLLNAEAIKKQEELNSIKKENDMEEYSDINDIWIKSFIGLIREGLKYDCIQMSDGNKIIRLTIDNIQFDCGIDKLQEELGPLYNQTINDTVNITYMDNTVNFIPNNLSKNNNEKSQKELELEKEIQMLKERAKKQKEQYLKEINYDSMTGLRNKKAFKEDIELLNCGCYFISIDANELKRTNDTLGHVYGDKLLTGIAENIKKIFGDYSYRTGGDEFYVILSDVTEDVVISKIKNLKDSLSSHSESGMTFSVSSGYAYSENKDDRQNSIEEADRQMYKDKQEYHSKHYYPDSRLGDDISSDDILPEPIENKQDDIEEEIVFDDINTDNTNKNINVKQKNNTQSDKKDMREQRNRLNIPNNQKESKESVKEVTPKYNYSFNKFKDVNTFIYDTYDLTVLAQGAENGDKIKMLIAPLKAYTDNNHPEIMCLLINKFGEIQRYASDELSPTLQVSFCDYEFIIRGMFVNGKFTSKIIPAGSTLAMGFSININTYVPQRSQNEELTNYGHLVFEHDGYIFHVVPMAKENDSNGVAPCFICIERPDKTKALVNTNENAITLFEDNGKSYQILTYWQNNLLCADII